MIAGIELEAGHDVTEIFRLRIDGSRWYFFAQFLRHFDFQFSILRTSLKTVTGYTSIKNERYICISWTSYMVTLFQGQHLYDRYRPTR